MPAWPDETSIPDWELHIWNTPQLTVDQRSQTIGIIRVLRGDLAAEDLYDDAAQNTQIRQA
jgi:hypothetical protein